jgi:CRISPR/Cas system CSM-associated protein Csm3 (group 7 of RAMP superfamily)
MISNRNSRNIVERIIVAGHLSLLTPAHFGNGEVDPYVDMPLSVDAYDGRPMINGTSLAGALRNALREHMEGYNEPVSSDTSAVVKLFGGRQGEPGERQSALIVEDALAVEPESAVELRDGVAICPETGAAAHGLKYDLDLLPAGTKFKIVFELLVPEGESEMLRRALSIVLELLAKSEIYLGARKRRGFGKCSVEDWQVWRYRLTTPQGLKGSLAHDHEGWPEHLEPEQGLDILKLLDAQNAQEFFPDKREYFEIQGSFELLGGILIRSGFEDLSGPDVMHLKSARGDEAVEVIPGTSLAGVLRGRALKIAQTLKGEKFEAQPPTLVDMMFGYGPLSNYDHNAEGRSSRVEVYEQVITNRIPEDVQQRVRIDRWTGGALDTGLFAEAPLGSGQVDLRIRLRKPEDHEVALLLQVWKDLWVSDLPIGGEASVGRGRLIGVSGELRKFSNGKIQSWGLDSDGRLLDALEEDVDWFKHCQQALLERVRR